MLFHLSTSGKSAVERERAVADLGGRSRLLRSYLTRNVLDELDPERREFLLATCTLGTLTGPLCDALLEREGSAAVLEELASRQFFTTLDDNGRVLPLPPGAADPARGTARRRARPPRGQRAVRAERDRCWSRRDCRGRRCAPTRWPRTSPRWRGCSSSPERDSRWIPAGRSSETPVTTRGWRWSGPAGCSGRAVRGRRRGVPRRGGAARRLGLPTSLRARSVRWPRVWLADATLPDQPGPDAAPSRAVAAGGPRGDAAAPGPRPAAAAGPRRGWSLAPGRGGRCAPPARSPRRARFDRPSSCTPTWPGWWPRSPTAPAATRRDAGGDHPDRGGRGAAVAGAGRPRRPGDGAAGDQPGSRGGLESCASLVEECERAGTHGGRCCSPVRSASPTRCAASAPPWRWTDRAVRGARSLNAPVLAAWAEAVGACATRAARRARMPEQRAERGAGARAGGRRRRRGARRCRRCRRRGEQAPTRPVPGTVIRCLGILRDRVSGHGPRCSLGCARCRGRCCSFSRSTTAGTSTVRC